MKLSVTMLNIMRYEDKKTGEPKVRIGYILTGKDAIQSHEKYKGTAEMSVFLDDVSVFDKVKVEDILTPVEFVLEERPSHNNPFRKVAVLKAIITKNETISLV